MALPAGVTKLGEFRGRDGDKGDKGDKGVTGTLAFALAEPLPAGAEPTVEMVGPEEERGAVFGLPAGAPGVGAVPADTAIGAYLKSRTTQSFQGLLKSGPRANGQLSLREWVEDGGLHNAEDGDNLALFGQVMSDLRGLYVASGQVHTAFVPEGRFAFSARLTPPLGGGFGIKGAGMDRTRFLTGTANSWLGMDQFVVGDPDFQWSDMVFEDFTVDGSAQPVSGSFVTGRKGFIMHNFRDTVFRRVKVFNTHATGFGIDYSDNVWFIECVADSCGRARRVLGLSQEWPFGPEAWGAGAGFGIGFGQKPDEAIFIVNSIARNNGTAGFYAEQLGQREGQHRPVGMVLSNVLAEKNMIGINDVGIGGMQVDGAISRNNLYAGYRVGIGSGRQSGGVNGVVNGLHSYGNTIGISLEGSPDGTYTFNSPEVFKNSREGVRWMDERGAFPNPNIRFRNPHVHANGSHGFLATTEHPVVDLEITDMLVHDNAGAGFAATSPLSRPKLTGRLFGNGDYAIKLTGSTTRLDSPIIDVDVLGSGAGSFSNGKTTDDTSRIRIRGDAAEVTQLVIRPVPDTGLTDWIATNAALTYEDGSGMGPHAVATITTVEPSVYGPRVDGLVEGEILTGSIEVTAPYGATIRPGARFGAGGTLGYTTGPVVRATGAKQRIHFTFVVKPGFTQARIGVLGLSNLPVQEWVVGNIVRVTKANITRGGQLWQYIDGSLPNCSWTGTAGASTSILRPPGPALTLLEDFERSEGAVGNGWKPAFAAGNTPTPFLISEGAGAFGAGGTAPNAFWYRESRTGNSIIEVKLRDVDERLMSIMIRAIDQLSFVRLALRRNSSTPTYTLVKRVGGVETELTPSAPSVTATAGDVIRIVSSGSSIRVLVNGSTIFGGPVTVTDLATETRWGVMLHGSAVTRGDTLEHIKYWPR